MLWPTIRTSSPWITIRSGSGNVPLKLPVTWSAWKEWTCRIRSVYGSCLTCSASPPNVNLPTKLSHPADLMAGSTIRPLTERPETTARSISIPVRRLRRRPDIITIRADSNSLIITSTTEWLLLIIRSPQRPVCSRWQRQCPIRMSTTTHSTLR